MPWSSRWHASSRPAQAADSLLLALWRDLPRANQRLREQRDAGRLDQRPRRRYSPRLRELFQWRVAGWIAATRRSARESQTGPASC